MEREAVFGVTLPEIDGYHMAPLALDDEPVVQAFIERCAEYVQMLTGLPPGPADAQSLLQSFPPGKTANDKAVIGIFDPGGRLAGVLDLIRDYPSPRVWWIGLLLLDPETRGKGLGERIYMACERMAVAADAAAIELSVAERNPRALAFWQRLGFVEYERRREEHGIREQVMFRLRRTLDKVHAPV